MSRTGPGGLWRANPNRRQFDHVGNYTTTDVDNDGVTDGAVSRSGAQAYVRLDPIDYANMSADQIEASRQAQTARVLAAYKAGGGKVTKAGAIGNVPTKSIAIGIAAVVAVLVIRKVKRKRKAAA